MDLNIRFDNEIEQEVGVWRK